MKNMVTKSQSFSAHLITDSLISKFRYNAALNTYYILNAHVS